LISYEGINSLRKALCIHPREIISLVGAGKITLMLALARELTNSKNPGPEDPALVIPRGDLVF